MDPKEIMESVEWGLLSWIESDNIHDTDYIWSTGYPAPRVKSDDNLIQVSQNDRGTSSCTITSTFTSVCINLWISKEVATPHYPILWKLAKTKWAREPGGWSVALAVDLVRNYINTNKDKFGLKPYEVLFSNRITLDSSLADEVLDAGYCLVSAFKGNTKYRWEKHKYGVIQGTTYKPSPFGHCICNIKKDGQRKHNDSYDKQSNNIYGFKNFKGLVKSWQFRNSAYLFYINDKRMASKYFKINAEENNNSIIGGPIFSDFSGDKPLTEQETKELINISIQRASKKIIALVNKMIKK